METVKKKFDKALYDVADKKAKEVMMGWLEKNTNSTDITMKENTYFDITCSISPDLPRHFYEVEIKYSWKGDWPSSWKDIRIPYRKKRLLDKWKKDHYNDLLTFVVFRDDCNKHGSLMVTVFLIQKLKKFLIVTSARVRCSFTFKSKMDI